MLTIGTGFEKGQHVKNFETQFSKWMAKNGYDTTYVNLYFSDHPLGITREPSSRRNPTRSHQMNDKMTVQAHFDCRWKS